MHILSEGHHKLALFGNSGVKGMGRSCNSHIHLFTQDYRLIYVRGKVLAMSFAEYFVYSALNFPRYLEPSPFIVIRISKCKSYCKF